MEVAGAAARLQHCLEPEASDGLEHLEEVMLAADLGAHDVAGLHRVPLIIDLDHRAALADEPVLVTVVVVAVEGLAGVDPERPGRGDVRPGGPVLALAALPDVASAGGVERDGGHGQDRVAIAPGGKVVHSGMSRRIASGPPGL